MSLFKGTLALRRYRVMQKPPEDWREPYDRAVRAHALVSIDRGRSETQSAGWCSVYDAQKLDFDAEYVEGHILLSLRLDVLKPDPSEVKKQVKLAAQRLEAERQAPLSKAALRDVKAMVILDLRKITPIKTRTVDAVWNLNAQRLYILSHSKKANEILIGLFAQTFGINMDSEGPGFWAEQYAHGMANELDEVAAKYQCGSTADERAGAERIDAIRLKMLRACRPTPELLGGFRGLRPCVMAGAPDAPDSAVDTTPDAPASTDDAGVTDRRFLGREFLTWLVMKAEGDGTTFEADEGDFKVNLGNRVLCKALGDGSAEIAARGDDSLEVRYAIAGGLTVRELDVLFSSGDRAWSLAVSAENFDLKRVKLPALLSEEDAERAHERLELIGQADAMLECAYGHFLNVRLSTEWPATMAAMRVWLKDSIEA